MIASWPGPANMDSTVLQDSTVFTLNLTGASVEITKQISDLISDGNLREDTFFFSFFFQCGIGYVLLTNGR